MDVPPPAKLEISRPVRAALVFCWVASALIGAAKLVSALGRDPHRAQIFDFHAFMIAGRLTWEGRLAEAYNAATMIRLEQLAGGRTVILPWSYPPLFALVLAPLSQLPIVLAFCLFVLGTFALYGLALRRLAGGSTAWLVLVTLAPCAIINLIMGQNGFLTGGLFAMAAASFVRRKPGQGALAIGALAYKPHMALVWPVLLAVRGRWATFVAAGAVAVALTAASVLIVGPEAFRAFLDAGAQATRSVAAYYQVHRITSLFAAGLTLGLAPEAALAVHVAAAAAIVAAMILVGRRLPEPAQAGLAVMSTVFLTPYFFDYDLPVFGVGLALVLPELEARMTRPRLGLLLAIVACAQVIGVAVSAWTFRPSLGGPLLLAAFVLMLRTLAQAPLGARNASPDAAPVLIGAG